MVLFIISSSILDNTPIQCSHGKVPVSKVGSMKRMSAAAWTKLFSKVSTSVHCLTYVQRTVSVAAFLANYVSV